MNGRQREILSSLNVSDKRIEEINNRGLNIGEKSFLDTAMIMLDYLEEKYDNKFEIVSGSIPNSTNKDYWINAHALKGEHAYKNFSTYLKDGKCSDEFFNILRRDEISLYITELLNESINNIKAYVNISYDYGKGFNSKTKISEIISKCDFTINVAYYGPDTSKEEFDIIANKVEKILNDNNIKFDGEVMCFLTEIDSINTNEELTNVLRKRSDENRVYSYYKNIFCNNYM